MGYYSTLDVGFTINKTKVKLLRIELKRLSELPEDEGRPVLGASEPTTDLILKDQLANTSVEDNGTFYFPEHYAKWYNTEVLATFFARFSRSGKIEFAGEDGTKWGHMWQNRKVFDCVYKMSQGTLIAQV